MQRVKPGRKLVDIPITSLGDKTIGDDFLAREANWESWGIIIGINKENGTFTIFLSNPKSHNNISVNIETHMKKQLQEGIDREILNDLASYHGIK